VRSQHLRDFLAELEGASRRVETTMLDLDRDRLVAERLGVDRYGTVVLQAAGDRVDVSERELFRATGPRGSREVAFVGEPAIAAGLRQLLSDRRRTLYWLRGHGERERYDRGIGELRALSEILDDQGFTVRDLDLLRDADGGAPSMPDDAAALLVVGPRAPLADVEEQAIDAWLRSGGAAAVFVDPGGTVPELLQRVGLSIPSGEVRDTAAWYPFEDRPQLRYGAHPITAGPADARLATLLSGPAPLVHGATDGVDVRSLLLTSPAGWIERGDERPAVFDPDVDGVGPIDVAVAVSMAPPHPWRGRMVVVGDTDWVADDLLEGSPGNASVLVSAVRWLVGDDERFAAVARPRVVRRVALTPRQLELVRWLLLGVLPLGVLLLGVVVQRQRRSM
jgi:hypothetical protein